MGTLDPSLVDGMPPFADLTPADLDFVLSLAKPVRYPKGTAVFAQGGTADSFFVLLHGHLQVVKLTPEGRQVVLRYVSPGEMFGIAVQTGRAAYPATAVAVADSIALAWPSDCWPALLTRCPALAAGIMRTVGSRLDEAHLRVVEMSTQEVERRVAHALVRLVRQAGRPVGEGIRIDFPITREDVAQMTGTTLHTVSRILSSWEQQGLVESGRQRIVVRDPDRLFALAERDGAR
ncbi:Crp/Fnr family transcriptional regulator [Methylobacterium dankookense]|jgi:CRP-like cAMP-binding protein|uniref:Cyclic AMP receptor protein n=1 Tax=Methylobacterium dankookense TaxID=560405 RepID=A0A564G1E7_9HYPH|nr:Crp/Fnr family transcriptional regulator [Methylobacterium dankookense]GJD57696.1 Cyclic AMP receptor protein [Methylobacterium dankookense]VUF13790.1 Cyclic AMP receptor protein [Methylobacterium dankookense]